MATERETRIPMPPAPGEGDGLYEGQEIVLPVDDLAEALQAAHGILTHIGGAVTFVALRQELAPNSNAFVTREVVMRWNSYVPAQRATEAVEFKVDNGADPVGEPAEAA